MIKTDGKKYYVNVWVTLIILCIAYITVALMKQYILESLLLGGIYTLLLLLAQSDFVYGRLPNSYLLIMLGLGAVHLIVDGNVVEKLLCFALFFIPFSILRVIFHMEIGGGDIKLMAFMALYMGIPVLYAIFIACLLSVIVVVYKIAMRRGKGKLIPFGPYMAIGVYLYYTGAWIFRMI